ncbi:MAG: FtsW/RodA/SpoVE family cell cycle protein, partial [Candidatus Liptonbacteria bacterium]
MSNIYKKIARHPDYFLLALVFLLTVSGLVILASASSELGKIRFNDSYYYLKHQLYTGLLVGVIGFFLAMSIGYQRYKKFALVLLLANIVFLVLVFTPLGVHAGGASRWLHLGPIVFQPAEFLKLTFLLYIAAWVSNKKARTNDFWSGALPFFIVCGVVGALLIMQPATSTVVILLTSGIIMYFESGVKFRYLIGFATIGAVALAIVIWATPYRMQRIMNFIHPEKDTQGSAYQINQALI